MVVLFYAYVMSVCCHAVLLTCMFDCGERKAEIINTCTSYSHIRTLPALLLPQTPNTRSWGTKDKFQHDSKSYLCSSKVRSNSCLLFCRASEHARLSCPKTKPGEKLGMTHTPFLVQQQSKEMNIYSTCLAISWLTFLRLLSIFLRRPIVESFSMRRVCSSF